MIKFDEEIRLRRQGYKIIVGLDEAGRGPLAGPVVAAAVTLRATSFTLQGAKLRDSKKLSPQARAKLYKMLILNPNIKWGIGRVYPRTIDRLNIFEATKLAMVRAIRNLERKLLGYTQKQNIQKTSDRGNFASIDFLIVDGKMKLDLPIPQKAIVKADEKVFSCAAASIIAKVTRDRQMQAAHEKYPNYGFDRHKGYGTKHHITMLKKLGRCAIHRNSFNYH